ncbi:MAG: transglycosylase SLT domain-containing protein [Pseudomonadota bacterium]
MLSLAGQVFAEDVFNRVGRAYHISPALLRAIAQVESSFHPYAIGIKRIGGKPTTEKIRQMVSGGRVVASSKLLSVFPKTYAQARRLIAWLEARGLAFDVGLCQLNSRTLRRYGLKPAWVLNPEYNLAWAAYHLARLFARHGYSYEAVWRYNGRREYANRVYGTVRILQ